MNKAAENIYKIIFSPRTALDEIKEHTNISSSLVLVAFMAVYLFTLRYDFNGEFLNFFMFLFSCIFVVINGLLCWMLLGGFLEFTAKIFDRSGKFEQFLRLSAYAMIPLIFLAPLELLKSSCSAGYFLGVFLEMFLYLWVIYLFVKAAQISYNLSFSRVIMLFFMPFIGTLFVISWVMEFFSRIVYIFKA